MKKLLVLMLVFGMASLANAELQISVGGDLNPADSEIWAAPSQMLNLGVWTTTPIYSGVGEGYFLLGVNPLHGSLSGGVSKYPTDNEVVYYSGMGTGFLPPEEVGDLGGIATFRSASNPITGIIVDSIIFHCERLGDAVVHLYEVPEDFSTTTLVDTVIIHQVPEPMTMALLGLGGLFLRRRKK